MHYYKVFGIYYYLFFIFIIDIDDDDIMRNFIDFNDDLMIWIIIIHYK